MLRIGISSCFFHADPLRPVFKGKTLLYLVEDVSRWLLNQNVLAYMIPTLPESSSLTLKTIVQDLDGLILQGGADVSPTSYGETPEKPEWSGDATRDKYETGLVKEFVSQNKPVFGICRGLQLLNVAFGGTLHQDIQTHVKGSLQHRNWEIYDQNFHEVEIVADSGLSKLFPNIKKAKVNSVHRQAIKTLAPGFKAEALSEGDQLIEAIRKEGPNYVMAVQWHPEFQDPKDKSILSTHPLLTEFLKVAEKRKKKNA